MNPYRAALIGCGRIGADCAPSGLGSSRINSHAQAYFEHPQTELVAAYDLDEESLSRCGACWGISGLYTDLGQMLECENPQIVSISTPPGTHLSLLERIAQHGGVLAMLIEKPLATTVEDANALMALLGQTKIRVAVNYIRRYPPIYREAIQHLRQEGLGTIQHIQVYYTKGVLNNASHAVDLLRAMFGDVESAQITGEPLDSSDLDPTISFQLRFSSGAKADFVALDQHEYNLFEIDILGSEERLVFRDQGHILTRYPVMDTRPQHGFRQLALDPISQPTDLSRAVYYAVDDLVASLENAKRPVCSLEDGITAMQHALEVIGQTKLENTS